MDTATTIFLGAIWGTFALAMVGSWLLGRQHDGRHRVGRELDALSRLGGPASPRHRPTPQLDIPRWMTIALATSAAALLSLVIVFVAPGRATAISAAVSANVATMFLTVVALHPGRRAVTSVRPMGASWSSTPAQFDRAA